MVGVATVELAREQARVRRRVENALALATSQGGDHRGDERVRILAGERAEVATEGSSADTSKGPSRASQESNSSDNAASMIGW